MDIDYKQVISFKLMKELMQEKGMTNVTLAEKCGCSANLISMIINGRALPKTDLFVNLFYTLKARPTQICEFKNIEQKKWFNEKDFFYKPGEEAVGELTYRPLRRLLDAYLSEANSKLKEGEKQKTADTFYDLVTPARRRNGTFDKEYKGVTAANKARGIEKKTESRNRRDYSNGLPYATRTKLRRDKPISLGTVYDICKVLGCSPDWVLSYK